MTTDNMPPPDLEAHEYEWCGQNKVGNFWDERSMRAYAEQQTAELRAEVERLTKLIDVWKVGMQSAEAANAKIVRAVRAKLSRLEQS